MQTWNLIIMMFSALSLRGQYIEVKRCNCYMLGTFETQDGKSLCDVSTGKCSCLKNVVGIDCDKCRDGYFGLYSGKGCKFCACNMLGALKQECDDISGKCSCKRGYSGHKCEKCPNDYPIINGKCCQCPKSSSSSSACDRKGRCKCKPHTQGLKCDECDENYYFDEKSGCTPCGPCYDLLKTTTKTYENKLETLMQSLELENLTTSAKEYEKFEKTLKDLKGRVENLKTKEINLLDYGVIKSLHDFFLRFDGVNETIVKLKVKMGEIGEKYNKTQSTLKSGMKQVRNERKLVDKLNAILKKSELIIVGLEKKTFDDEKLKKTVEDVKLIGEETKKLLDSSYNDVSELKGEVVRVMDFTEKIRSVKEEVVQRLGEAENFKTKVSRLKINGIDLEIPAVEVQIGKFEFQAVDFDLKQLKDKLDKVQGYVDYIGGVKQQNEETVNEFMQIQTNFNLQDILKRLDEIKKSINELMKNYNTVNEKFNTDVIPNIERIQENVAKLDKLDEIEIRKILEDLSEQHKKLDVTIGMKENLTKSLQIQEDELEKLQHIPLSDFEDEYDAVAKLVEDYDSYEDDVKGKIAICEDLIRVLKGMPVYEDNRHELDEAEIEIEKLERYYEQLEYFRKIKLDLESDVKRIEEVLDGFPEERNWCNVKETFT